MSLKIDEWKLKLKANENESKSRRIIGNSIENIRGVAKECKRE